jgi:hypothetical protein
MSFVTEAVGNILGGGSSSAPAAPDYTAAAEATAKGNLDAARATTAANRVNQVTPYGNVNYEQTGTDQYGNPTWTATQTPTAALQGAIDKSTGAVGDYDFNQFNPSELPSVGINPGETYSDAIMRRLQPQIQQQNEMSDQQLANQGIMPGSQAYNNAKQLLQQGQNDKLTSAITGGFDVGLRANANQYGQDLSKYNTNLSAPFTYASNVKALATPNYVNPTNQPATTGADYLGATTATGNYNMSNYNAEQARNAALTGGLMNVGGMIGAASIMSDIRTKENIVEIGVSKIGLPVYVYEYKPEWKDEAGHGKFVGYMAHEVEAFMPQAVVTRPDGYKMVNYGALNA